MIAKSIGKSIASTLFFLFISVLLFTACRSKKGAENYIPKDAAAIITINTSNIVPKLLFNNFEGIDLKSFLSLSEIFFLNDVPIKKSPINAFFRNPGSSGLNLLDDIYVYVNDFSTEKKKFSGVFWNMDNAKKFETFLESNIAQKYNITIEDNNRFKTASFENYKFAFGWNKEILVAIFPMENTEENASLNKLEDIFEMRVSESISNDTNFVNLEKENDDITVFARPEKLKSYTEKLFPNAFYGGVSYLNAHINFDDEDVKVNIKQYLQEEAITLYKDLLSENLNSKLCEEIDDSELVAFLNFKYDKGFMAKFVKFYKMRLALKAVVAATGVNENDLYELTEGDVFIAYARNNQQKDNEILNDSLDQDIKLPCFVAEVKTSSKMPTFLEKMSQNGILNKEEDVYNMKEILGYDTFIKLNENKMLVTNDSSFVSKKKRRIIPEPDSEIQKLSEGYPVSAYVNFDRFISEASAIEQERFIDSDYFEVANLLKTASFYTKPLQDNVMKSRLEIQFKERNENSLSSLIRLLSLIEKNRNKSAS